jgi:hypothetical protein
MKAVLINCADPLSPTLKHPNPAEGFGSINLGRWLPFPGDDFAMVIADRVSITDKQHLVSSVLVVNTDNDLRITMSYLDAATSADLISPFLSDLDLIVISPSKTVFRGNHRVDGTEEHFSEHERVIVFQSELERGTYEIHVICSAHELLNTVEFAVVAVGDIAATSDGFLHFSPADKCATECGAGTCDQSTSLCNCPRELRAGQSCQQSVALISPGDDPVRIKLDALGTRYLGFSKPEGVSGDLMFTVNKIGTDEYWFLYHESAVRPHGATWTYDDRCNGSCQVTIPHLGPQRVTFSALLRSNSVNGEEFEASAHLDIRPNPTSSPSAGKSGLSAGAIAGIAIGGAALAGAAAVAVLWILRRVELYPGLRDEPLAVVPP